MNTLKTIVVVTTLLAVGYGAHVFLSKPIPNGPFGMDSSFGSRFGSLPSFDKPMVELPAEATGLNDAPRNGLASFASSDAKSRVELPSRTTPPGLSAAPAPAMVSSADGGNLSGSHPTAPSLQAAVATTELQMETGAATAGNVMIPGATSVASAVQQSSATSELVSSSAAGMSAPTNRFEEIWFEAEARIKNGQLVDVLLSLSMLYRDTSLTAEQKNLLVPLLDQLAGSVIYSNNVQIDAPYVVSAGETLESIAAENLVNPAFIMRTNQLSSPQLLAGQRLKMVRGPFRGELSIGTRELTLFLGRYYAGRFPVAIGREFPTNLNMLEVSGFTRARDYLDPRTGERIPAGDPNNPYGDIWIGLQASQAPELNNLALHAYGVAVGASDTRGCISLSPEDADDLSAILTIGSIVEVVP